MINKIKKLPNGKRIVLMNMDKICRASLFYAKRAYKQIKRPDPFTYALFDITLELTKIDYIK